jgi:hypothetical protein
MKNCLLQEEILQAVYSITRHTYSAEQINSPSLMIFGNLTSKPKNGVKYQHQSMTLDIGLK